MLRNDKQFELVFDAAEAAEGTQSGRICEFVRRSLIRRSASICAPSAANDSQPIERRGADVHHALSPVEPGHNLIVFDIPSLIRHRHRRKTAVLSPYTITKHLYGQHGSPQAQLELFQAVQESLHAADCVVAFSEDHARLLAMLGAPNPIRAPLPTSSAKTAAANGVSARPSGDLLIINHAADDKMAASLARSVEADQALTASIVDCSNSDASTATGSAPPVDAAIHVHVGTGATVAAPWRIVDSYAQQKPVIHLVDHYARAQDLSLAEFQMSVEHNTSGLRLSCIREVVAAAKSLRDDAAMADLFRRNADRLNSAFNFAIEERMFGQAR